MSRISVASLAQQIANQPLWEQQWARPKPPLPVHQGAGTNGSQPSKARSTHSARATAWRKPSLTKSLTALRAQKRADEEDEVQLGNYRACVGLSCWSSCRLLCLKSLLIYYIVQYIYCPSIPPFSSACPGPPFYEWAREWTQSCWDRFKK